ncbi:MAG: DUF4270 family protein [Candidatus Methylacidiphilales bacterium]
MSVIALTYSSCKKDINTLAVNFINPDSTFNGSFETVGLNAYTDPSDSLPTHTQSLYILGAINDPIFGKSSAEIATSYSIPNNAASFSLGNNAIVDSVVLQLRIGNDSTWIGDANAIHDIKVYELTEKLDYNTVYYSNRNYQKSNTIIGNFNKKFSQTDSIANTYINSSVKIPPSIRITLSDDFKQKIQNINTFINVVDTNKNFYNLFKGFAIVDESNFGFGQGGFWYLNLNSSYTSMVVYYRNDTTRLRTEFPITLGNARYNKYNINSKDLTQPKTTRFKASQQRDTCYLQAMGSTRVRVFIPDSILNRLAAVPQLGIQKAEIVVRAMDGFSTDMFKIPNQLILLSMDSTGTGKLTKDSDTESLLFVGGNVNNGEYRFNIARELNFILKNLREKKGNVHYGLSILVPNSTFNSFFQTSARRVVLNTKNLKLNLNYTVIK